jgi:transcriptional regulator with XRE-family HTH domain
MKHPDFAERFKQAVRQSGVKDTQKELSKLFGVSEVMIWSYKNGEKLPRMAMAISIAEKLNTSVEWLLQGTGSAIKEPMATYDASPLKKSTREAIDLLESLSEAERKEALKLLKKTFKSK